MCVQGQGEESFIKWRMEKIIGSEVRWFDIYFPLLKEEKDILEKGIPREKDVATFFKKAALFHVAKPELRYPGRRFFSEVASIERERAKKRGYITG